MPFVIISIGIAAMITSSCGSSWQISGRRIIAFVNKQPIYYAAFDSVVKDQRVSKSTPEKNAEAKRKSLDTLIDDVLMQQSVDSVYKELKTNTGFQKKQNDYLEKPVLKLMYQSEIANKAEITDAQLRKYYDDNIDRYKTPEQIRASHILIKADIDSTQMNNPKKVAAAEKKAKALADQVYQRALNGEDFAKLAEEYSKDPGSAKRGGDLGYFSRGRMVKPFEDAAFSMKVDEISQPIKSEFGYHIIKFVEHKAEETKPFDGTMKEQIKQTEKSRTERENAQAYVDSVKEAAVYTYNKVVLANDEDSTLKDQDWVVIVNALDTLTYAEYKDQKPKYMRYKNIDKMAETDQIEMLKTLSVTGILLQIAKQKGYFQDSTIVSQADQFMMTQARNRIEEARTAQNFEPSDSALQAYFDAHIDEFIVDKPLHVYHLIFTDSITAKAVYDSLKAGADFVQMAKHHYPGEPEIREVAYDLDFISEKEMPKEFWNAANALQVGEISPPVKTEWGWHVIKLVSRKSSKNFDQVKSRIKSSLKKEADEQASKAFMAKLRDTSDIKINKKLLDEYVITLQLGGPTMKELVP